VSQVLELVYIGVFLVMIVSAMLNAGAVRVWRARVGTFRTAIKHVIATPLFWLQMICTAFSLVVGILHRLETYSFAEIVLEVRTGVFVVFTATCIFAALGFYFGGEFIEKEEDQAP
jgi:hypothetical protein